MKICQLETGPTNNIIALSDRLLYLRNVFRHEKSTKRSNEKSGQWTVYLNKLYIKNKYYKAIKFRSV